MSVDPITREVVQNRLISIVREMSHSLSRAAYSPIIYEVKDFSNVLLRPTGELVAQAEGIPVFLGAMSPVLRAVLERYPVESIAPGDVFISNDPYTAYGTHKNDVNVVRPIFAGEILVLFAACKAHWTDIGGKDPGSWSPDATNVYQEGVSIPPLRLIAGGQMNDELFEMVLSNTRVRVSNEGDLLAQLGACHVADERIAELLGEYAWHELDAYIDSLLDYAEAQTRAVVESIPDGVYEAEDWVDSDGVSDEPFRITVRVTVSGDEIELDFSDCPEQRYGGCGNATWASSASAAKVAFKCATLPHAHTNEGTYRPLTIVTRPGTVVHPVSPAPVTIWGDVGRAIIEAVLRALGQADADRAIAGFYGNVDGLAIAGDDPRTGSGYISFSPYAGGWGARPDQDGVSALCPIINGDNANVPVEVVENRYPLQVERYELVQDSGGPGEFRGGLGVRIDYRVMSENTSVSASLDRYSIAPPGVQGGREGALSGLYIDSGDGIERPAHKVAGLPVPRGALVSHRTGGGGGHGDPSRRDRNRVRADVLDGYVSEAAARTVYGYDLSDDIHPVALSVVDGRGEATALLADLVRAPSPNPPGDERAAVGVARAYLESIPGSRVRDVGVAANRPMLVAELHGGAGPGLTLIFAGHIDTVPLGSGWTHDPVGAEVVDGRMYGRGTSDMKGGIAGFLVALRELAERSAEWAGTIVAHVVPDEEPGGQLGALTLLERGLIVGDAAIVAEPSELAVYRAQKGNLFARLRFKGRSAHGSTPDQGDNAVSRAARFAVDLEDRLKPLLAENLHELVGPATISLGTIRGGVRTNVVPDECALTIDRRVLPGESLEAAQAQLESFVDGRAEVSYEAVGAAFETPSDHWLVEAACAAVQAVRGEPAEIGGLVGSSDARFYAAGAGVPTVIIGPGSMSEAHVPDESIELKLLEQSVAVYRELALRVLARDASA
jgi:N-methylhydantoinase B